MIHHKHYPLISGIAVSMTAIVGLVIYFETRAHRKLKEEVLMLDKNIKELQLVQHIQNA